MSTFAMAGLVSAAVFLAGCSHSALQPTPNSSGGTQPPAASSPASSGMTVSYENGAFSPAMLNAKVGDKLTFKNAHTAALRISKNVHHIHQCCKEFAGFDSDTLAPGETYEYTVNAKGALEYHNHFNPGVLGKVVVE